NSGALRVIPGSHRNKESFGDLLESHLTSDIFGMTGDQIPAVALESNPGDVLVFNHRIKHSSWGGSDRRRMFTMNFSERYPDHLIPDLKDFLAGEARFFIDRMHGPAMIKTATPERMHHLEQVRENDTHMADVVKKMRESGKSSSQG
ncbi:MAG: phytanoyl-CoA dioxygenase family protein, partial [SAR202 cluster bacterium]|nr:phytanoyl-CoA dioxygenase family protein [SAR202 cluster bacterium]